MANSIAKDRTVPRSPPKRCARRVARAEAVVVPARIASARSTSRRSALGAEWNHFNGTRLAVEDAIREVQGTRVAVLRSTIALAPAYLRRAEQSRDQAAASRSLQHARAGHALAERLLSANELGPEATASVRDELFALRRQLENTEPGTFAAPPQLAV